VEAVNVLRTSQAAYLNAVEETRLRMRQGNNEPVEVVINGRTFEGTQAAFTQLFQLANSLEEEPAVRFGRSLAVDLIKEIQPMINPREHVLDLADVGFTAQSNIELIIDQELATGGLARNEYARDLLHEHGFSTVVAPRLESYAGAYRLYVTVYDLERKRIANTSSMRFDEEFTPEIRERLGLE